MASTVASNGSFARYSSTETGQEGSRTAGDINAEQYDLLTFLSQLFSSISSSQEIYLLSTFLDEVEYLLPRERSSGATSRVVVIESEALVNRGVHQPYKPILAGSVAIKMAKPSALQGGTAAHRTLLRSMAAELRILREESIRAQDNIVTLLGTCWQHTGDNQDVLLPVFVYEAAELGDLKTWLPRNSPDVTLGVQLELCLGIARGVACLHEAGAVHCDVKPENVLIFRQDDPGCPFVPKIIDFNIAVIFQDAPDRAPLPAGTIPWNSPEQMTETFICNGDLPKVDIYSLGLLILDILTLGRLKSSLDSVTARGVRGVSLLDFKQSGSLALNAANFLGSFGLVSGRNGDKWNFPRFGGCWMRASLLVCEALDGDLGHRTASVSQIVDGLETLRVAASEHGLLGYTNRNLHREARSGAASIMLNEGK
jgi:serine/threonine protein kinase